MKSSACQNSAEPCVSAKETLERGIEAKVMEFALGCADSCEEVNFTYSKFQKQMPHSQESL